MNLYRSKPVANTIITACLSLLAACGGGGGGGGGGSSDPTVLPLPASVNCPVYAVNNSFVHKYTSVFSLDDGVVIPPEFQIVVTGLIAAINLTYDRTMTVTAKNASTNEITVNATFSDQAVTDIYTIKSTASDFSILKTVNNRSEAMGTTSYVGAGLTFCTPPAVDTIFTGTILYPDGSTATAKLTVTLVGTQAVTVPAGSFPDARRIDTVLKLYDSSGNYISGADITGSMWFDDVVGEVKSQTVISKSVMTFSGKVTNTFELQSYNKP